MRTPGRITGRLQAVDQPGHAPRGQAEHRGELARGQLARLAQVGEGRDLGLADVELERERPAEADRREDELTQGDDEVADFSVGRGHAGTPTPSMIKLVIRQGRLAPVPDRGGELRLPK